MAHYLTGNRDSALNWYLESIKLFETKQDTIGLVGVYSEMCVLYLKQKKTEQAKQIIDKAIALAKAIHASEQLATAYNNKGLLYQDKDLQDSASYFFTLGYTYYKVLNNQRGMAYSLNYLASISAAKEETAKALSYLRESVQLMKASGDLFGEAVGINNIGELLLQHQQPKEAIAYFEEANAKTKVLHFKDLEDNTYAMLAQCYEQLGAYKQANAALQRHIALHEELANEHLQKTIEELDTKYETDKKDQKNWLLAEENRLQLIKLSQNRIILVAVVVIALLIIGMLYLLHLRHKLQQAALLRDELLKAEQATTIAIIDAEEYERQRLARELHDGIGQLLIATRRQIEQTGQTMAQKLPWQPSIALIDETIKEVRLLSKVMMPPWLQQQTLFEALDALAKRTMQVSELKVTTEWVGVQQAVITKMQVLMIYRSVQEMITNTLKHAAASEIHLEIVLHEGEWSIVYYDNGKGFDLEAIMNSGKGIGLKNIALRIKYIGGTMEIDSSPNNGVTYNIAIPIKATE